MRLAVRGQSELLIPDGHVAWARRYRYEIREAPKEAPEVTVPTPLAEAMATVEKTFVAKGTDEPKAKKAKGQSGKRKLGVVSRLRRRASGSDGSEAG